MLYGNLYRYVLLLVFMVGQEAMSQQEPVLQDDGFAAVLKQEVEGLSQTSIDEIIEIRSRLGGGIGLDLSYWDDVQSSWKNRLFSDSKSSLDHQKPLPESASTASEKLFFEMLQDIQPIDVGRNMARISNSCSRRTAEIRITARRIDDLAADLEDLELFGDADSLRTLATEIRKKARRIPRTAEATRITR